MRRALTTTAVLAVLLAAAAATVATGAYGLSWHGVLATLTGGGSATDRQIVLGQRLPRLVAAALVGAVLSASGAVFQSLSRNPLGSPDVLGFTTGSASGALLIGLLAPDGRDGSPGGASMAAGAVAGGFATAAVVLLLARRERGLGTRLILVGIAVGALLSSLNDYLLTRADLEEAEQAKTWLYGSLNALRWESLAWAGPAAVLLLAALMTRRRELAALELGEDLAAGLGVPVHRATRRLMVLATALTATGITISGPIGFLALAAPQLAHRLWRTAGLSLPASALLGSTVLVVADFLAARLLSPFEIPVGLVTGALGGVYLLWLLRAERARF